VEAMGANQRENPPTLPGGPTAEYGTQVALSPRQGRDFEDWRAGMLETIAIILIVLWLLGVVSGYTMGNFIYVLLVIAIVLFLVRLVSGRRVV
jgi:hypothetical protein